jgi:hypothetical protein
MKKAGFPVPGLLPFLHALGDVESWQVMKMPVVLMMWYPTRE